MFIFLTFCDMGLDWRSCLFTLRGKQTIGQALRSPLRLVYGFMRMVKQMVYFSVLHVIVFICRFYTHANLIARFCSDPFYQSTNQSKFC